jgi:hypothetical protein
MVAVPVGDGVALAEMVNTPDTFELFVVVHTTLGSTVAAEAGLLVASVDVATTPTSRQKDARTLFSFTRLRLNPKWPRVFHQIGQAVLTENGLF